MRVHDKRGVAEGASGRNGGFALSGGATRYDIARETYGREQALQLWRWTEETLDRMAELAGDALTRPGSYRLAADEEEREQIRAEYEALREDGIAAEWIDDFPRFHGAISHPGDGSIQPARFVRRLAARAAAAGAEFREHDEVEDVDALDADHVIVATDGYGRGLLPELADALWPVRGQVVVSEPLERVLYDRPHYARQGFDYWQQLPDRRLLLGGFRDVSIMDEMTDVEETTPTIQASLERFLGELSDGEARISHRWAGIFALTQDMIPLVGPVPRPRRRVDRGRLLRARQRHGLRVRRARRGRDPRRGIRTSHPVRSRALRIASARERDPRREAARRARRDGRPARPLARFRAARSPDCSARAAAASRRCSARSSACSASPAARSRCSACRPDRGRCARVSAT